MNVTRNGGNSRANRGRRLALAAAVLMASEMLTLRAAAADDSIELSDGTVISGQVIERKPGDHVTLLLPTKETRTIPWSQIRSGAGTSVSVESDRSGTTLYKVTGTGVATNAYGGVMFGVSAYAPVCVAPCRATVDPKTSFVVGGDGIPRSSEFRLPDGASTSIQVEAGSTATRVAGWVLFGVGACALAGGVVQVAIESQQHKLYDVDYKTGMFSVKNEAGSPEAGIALIVGGTVAAAIGLALVVTNRTKVKDESGRRIAQRSLPLAPGVRLSPRGITF